jgi:hypothetical protein
MDLTKLSMEMLRTMVDQLVRHQQQTPERFALYRSKVFAEFLKKDPTIVIFSQLLGTTDAYRIVSEVTRAIALTNGETDLEVIEGMKTQALIAFHALTLDEFNATLTALKDQITCRTALPSIKPVCPTQQSTDEESTEVDEQSTNVDEESSHTDEQ